MCLMCFLLKQFWHLVLGHHHCDYNWLSDTITIFGFFLIPSGRVSDLSFFLFKQISLLVFSVLSALSKIFHSLQKVQRTEWEFLLCVLFVLITKLLCLQ